MAGKARPDFILVFLKAGCVFELMGGSILLRLAEPP